MQINLQAVAASGNFGFSGVSPTSAIRPSIALIFAERAS